MTVAFAVTTFENNRVNHLCIHLRNIKETFKSMHGKIRKQKLVQKNLTEKELKHETENVIKLFCSSAEH